MDVDEVSGFKSDSDNKFTWDSNEEEDEEENEVVEEKPPPSLKSRKRKHLSEEKSHTSLLNGCIGKTEVNDNSEEYEKPPEKKIRPPTAEEMIHLKETENLFKSNLLRLEIEEMLKEVRPLKFLKKVCRHWVDSFKTFVMNIKPRKPKTLSDLSWLEKFGVKLPISEVEPVAEHLFQFAPPVEIRAVGSFSAGILPGRTFDIDIALVLPKLLFKKKDYKHGMYELKRAVYLCWVGSRLRGSELITEEVEFSWAGGAGGPTLALSLSGKAAGHVTAFIHAVPEAGTFLPAKLAPHTSHLASPSPLLVMPATPFYNSSILHDVVMLSNEEMRTTEFEGTNMKHGMALLRVWLRQRELDQGIGSFTPYIMSMLIIYLRKKQKINKLMSSYQIVRNVWVFLSQTDWSTSGISLCTSECPNIPSLSTFHGYFDVVFVDPSGYLNLTSHVNKFIYLKVKNEATSALQLLDNREINCFQPLFMTKIPFLRQYDHVICVSDEDVVSRVVGEQCTEVSRLDRQRDGSVLQFMEVVSSLLSRGLGHRALHLAVAPYIPPRWSISSPPSTHTIFGPLLFGITLEPEKALVAIEKGPQANLPEAEDFREFWSGRSELRRYRDGDVSESVVWAPADAGLQRRLLIPKQICSFLLEDKLALKPSDYLYIADQFNPTIINEDVEPVETSCLRVHESLEELTKQLMGLKDLPLRVSSVMCISPAYRFTMVSPPVPDSYHFDPVISSGAPCLFKDPLRVHRAPSFVPAIDLMLEMSVSGKWPEDIAACRRLSAAFYSSIGQEMQKKHKVYFILHTDSLIIQKNGIMFRMRLANSKEVGLIKLRISEVGMKYYRDTPESIELENRFIAMPKISGALHGLSLLWPGFGGAARMAKRWLASQMLDDYHFPSIVVELMVAELFLRPEPYQPPLQPQTAFLRFLHKLASTNWHQEPLIVNLNNNFSKDDMDELDEMFRSERDNLPALYVASPYDYRSNLTLNAPSLATLVRLAKLASNTLRTTEMLLTSIHASRSHLSVFLPSVSIYDCQIELVDSFVPRRGERLQPGTSVTQKFKSRPHGKHRTYQLPITDFNPPSIYINLLRDHYSDFALFFYDEFGGSIIGVLFKPEVFQQVGSKASSCGARKLFSTGKEKGLLVDVMSIINDFKEMGASLVSNIVISDKLKERIKDYKLSE